MTIKPGDFQRRIEAEMARQPRLQSFSEYLAYKYLLPDELFGEVMQGMVDSAWLRERAETIQASGGPDSNAKAAALLEAADAADGAATSGSPDAAP